MSKDLLKHDIEQALNHIKTNYPDSEQRYKYELNGSLVAIVTAKPLSLKVAQEIGSFIGDTNPLICVNYNHRGGLRLLYYPHKDEDGMMALVL